MQKNPAVLIPAGFFLISVLYKDQTNEPLKPADNTPTGQIPFQLNNVDKIDRKEIVSILYFSRENVIITTRRTHIEKYREINGKLLKILRDEFNL